jgi:hypothetical protein
MDNAGSPAQSDLVRPKIPGLGAWVSDAVAGTLALVAADPTSPIAWRQAFQVEQRFTCWGRWYGGGHVDSVVLGILPALSAAEGLRVLDRQVSPTSLGGDGLGTFLPFQSNWSNGSSGKKRAFSYRLISVAE